MNNNTSITPYGTDAFRAAMINVYDVDHPSKSQELLDKKAENYRNKTGYDNPTQNPDVISSALNAPRGRRLTLVDARVCIGVYRLSQRVSMR
jgi:hypothetical protein